MSTRADERKRRMIVLRQHKPSLSDAAKVAPPTWIPDAPTDTAEENLADEFLASCGGNRSIQLLVSDSTTDWSEYHTLERPFLLVGQSEECDLQLTHPDISFRHAYLQVINGRLLCIDLASRSGTFWNARRNRSGWLDEGEAVTIGPYTLCHVATVESSDHNTGSDSSHLIPQSSLSSADLPRVSLQFANAREESQTPPSKLLECDVTLLGWSRHCKVQLEHKSVSRVHCSVVLTPDGPWLVDLLGRDGTKVNGERVRFAPLDDGSELTVGRFRLEVRYEERGLARPRSGFSEDFVLSLVNQFAEMQQQMFEQTQQQMMMLTQMFASMHQKQQDMIREDLIRVHEIIRELQQIQGQLLLEEGTPEAATHVEDFGNPVGTVDAFSEVGEERFEESEPVDAQLEALSPVGAEEQITGSGQTADDEDSPVEVETPATDDVPSQKSSAKDPETSAPRSDRRAVDEHAWLVERMAILEKERNSRWKKMMRVLTGHGGHSR